MITNNDENSYSKTYKKNKFKYWKMPKKLHIDQFPPQGEHKSIFRPKIEF